MKNLEKICLLVLKRVSCKEAAYLKHNKNVSVSPEDVVPQYVSVKY
jgi:hypothetical protein